MTQDIRPFLVKAARDVVLEGVRAYMRGRGIHAAQIERSERLTVIDVTPTDSDCPYCEVALFLAGARMYLGRVGIRPSFAEVYCALARHRLLEAGKAARRLSPGMENLMIQREIRAIETALTGAIGSQQAIQGIDVLADKVLDLAEKGDTSR